MYKVKDNVYDNRWVTMSDGYIVKFVSQFAQVPDKYIEYFRKISDFNIHTHTPEVSEPVKEEETTEMKGEEESIRKTFKKIIKD